MAFPAIRSEALSQEGGNTTSHTINYPATIEAGDTLLCCVASDGDNTFDWAGATSPTSGGWTKLAEGSSSDNQVALSIGYAEADGDEDGLNFELSSTENEESCARMFCISGATDPDTTAPAATGVGQSPGSTTVNFTALTPGGGAQDFLWFICAAYDDDDGGMTTNYPTNYQTNSQYDISSTGAGTGSLDTSYRTNNAATETPGSGTQGTAEEYCVCTVAIFPAAAPTGHIMPNTTVLLQSVKTGALW